MHGKMDIEKLLQNPEYDFLRTNADLSRIIYLTLSGSHGYGTNTEYSDVDLRGVLLEDKRYLFGLQTFEQFEDIPTDTVIYGLKKFVKLCVQANPNVLELLGTDESDIVVMTDRGKQLRDHADLFLTKRVIYSFGHYATAQFNRLQNALCHDHYDEEQKQKHLRDTLNVQLGHIQKTYASFENGTIKIYVEGGELKFDVKLNKYPVGDFVRIYSELSNTVKVYNKLNRREFAKDEKRLYKHAMHLIRLYISGADILKGKGIVTKRRDEQSLLMNIRNGKYGFNEIFKLVDEYKSQFEQAAEATRLPIEPDIKKVEKLMIELY